MPKYICPTCKWESDFTSTTCGICQSAMRDFLPSDAKAKESRIPQALSAPIELAPTKCPFCGNIGTLVTKSQISNAGWIFAIVLLLFLCLPLFWIGFLITEEVTKCTACGTKIS